VSGISTHSAVNSNAETSAKCKLPTGSWNEYNWLYSFMTMFAERFSICGPKDGGTTAPFAHACIAKFWVQNTCLGAIFIFLLYV